MINGFSLFSGIGGLDVALLEYIRPIAYCEIEQYCQSVLLSRMFEGKLHMAPIWNDIMSFDGKPFYGQIDIIYGGFPCQDISIAGFGKGLEGKRSRLFFEIVRLAKEIKPSFIFLENVPAITTRDGLRVVSKIAEMGYDCRWCIISAASVGAPHKRERWFLLAHTHNNGQFATSLNTGPTEDISNSSKRKESSIESKRKDTPRNVAYAGFFCERCEEESKRSSFHDTRCRRFWETEPRLDRVVDGLLQRVDRIRALGNAVVPEQAKKAFEI